MVWLCYFRICVWQISGELIALFINGWFSERCGYRWTVIGCLVLISAWAAVLFIAQNVQALLIAEILCCIVSLDGFASFVTNICFL